jgi:hypothetical protein
MVCRGSDEGVGVSAERTLSESHFCFRTIIAPDVVTIPCRQLELTDYLVHTESVVPTFGCANSHMSNVVVRILMGWRFVNANDSFS